MYLLYHVFLFLSIVFFIFLKSVPDRLTALLFVRFSQKNDERNYINYFMILVFPCKTKIVKQNSGEGIFIKKSLSLISKKLNNNKNN